MCRVVIALLNTNVVAQSLQLYYIVMQYETYCYEYDTFHSHR